MKVSPVIAYFPVSPVAPPNSTTFVLLTIVIVCPNLARGISPYTSKSSTAPFVLCITFVLEAYAGAFPGVVELPGLAGTAAFFPGFADIFST
jgi:hypothetical protein